MGNAQKRANCGTSDRGHRPTRPHSQAPERYGRISAVANIASMLSCCLAVPTVLIGVPAFTMVALFRLAVQADAQTPCPEWTRLRSEAVDGLTRVPASERYESYIRFSLGWEAIVVRK